MGGCGSAGPERKPHRAPAGPTPASLGGEKHTPPPPRASPLDSALDASHVSRGPPPPAAASRQPSGRLLSDLPPREPSSSTQGGVVTGRPLASVFGRQHLSAAPSAYTMQFREMDTGHGGGFVLLTGRQRGQGPHVQIEASSRDPNIIYRPDPQEPGVGNLFTGQSERTSGAQVAAVETIKSVDDQEWNIVIDGKRRVQLRWIDNGTKLQALGYPQPYPGHMDPLNKLEPRADLPRFTVTSPDSMTGDPKENFNKGIFDIKMVSWNEPQPWQLCKVRPQLDHSLGIYVVAPIDEVLLSGILAARMLL